MNARGHALTIKKLPVAAALLAAALLAPAQPAQAGPREQAIRIYNRIAGVPPSEAEISAMQAAIAGGNYRQAAQMASSSFHFYNTNLVRWAHRFGNRDETPRPEANESTLTPLNDFVATIVGMVRDNVPFDQVLYGDIIYTGAAGLPGVTASFSFSNNDLYRQIGDLISQSAGGLDLSKTTTLVQATQTGLRNTHPDVAGVLTTRQSGLAFFSAGTNRRPLRYALKEFLCSDPAALMDTTVPDIRVRRDVERAPTGNTQVYLTSCKGCHSGIDALSGAFAYFDFENNALSYTAGAVKGKNTRNGNNYPSGFQTTDDAWVNLWVNGQNAKLGWKPGSGSGQGAHALGMALAGTRQFAVCMATRAIELACVRTLTGDNAAVPTAAESAAIQSMADSFVSNGYNMRTLIEDAAILPQCRGE